MKTDSEQSLFTHRYGKLLVEIALLPVSSSVVSGIRFEYLTSHVDWNEFCNDVLSYANLKEADSKKFRKALNAFKEDITLSANSDLDAVLSQIDGVAFTEAVKRAVNSYKDTDPLNTEHFLNLVSAIYSHRIGKEDLDTHDGLIPREKEIAIIKLIKKLGSMTDYKISYDQLKSIVEKVLSDEANSQLKKQISAKKDMNYIFHLAHGLNAIRLDQENDTAESDLHEILADPLSEAELSRIDGSADIYGDRIQAGIKKLASMITNKTWPGSKLSTDYVRLFYTHDLLAQLKTDDKGIVIKTIPAGNKEIHDALLPCSDELMLLIFVKDYLRSLYISDPTTFYLVYENLLKEHISVFEDKLLAEHLKTAKSTVSKKRTVFRTEILPLLSGTVPN